MTPPWFILCDRYRASATPFALAFSFGCPADVAIVAVVCALGALPAQAQAGVCHTVSHASHTAAPRQNFVSSATCHRTLCPFGAPRRHRKRMVPPGLGRLLPRRGTIVLVAEIRLHGSRDWVTR